MDQPSSSSRPVNGVAQPPPPARELTLTACDGTKLGAVVSLPRGEPRGAVVILGAMAVASRYYRRFTEHLAQAGWAAVRFDYRGVGLSRTGPLRSESATLDDWIQKDAEAALAYARERFAGVPLVLVGHSLGGQCIGLTSAVDAADAAVIVSAGSGWLGNWPLVERVRLQTMMGAVMPVVSTVAGYIPGWLGLGEDLPSGVAMQWRSWCLLPGYLTDAIEPSKRRHDELEAPLLMWSFTDDEYAPAVATEQMLAWYGNASIERRRLSPSDTGRKTGHFGFFRSPSQALWDETLKWLDQRVTR